MSTLGDSFPTDNLTKLLIRLIVSACRVFALVFMSGLHYLTVFPITWLIPNEWVLFRTLLTAMFAAGFAVIYVDLIYEMVATFLPIRRQNKEVISPKKPIPLSSPPEVSGVDSAALVQSFFESIPGVGTIKDLSGNLIFANREYAALTGKNLKDVIG